MSASAGWALVAAASGAVAWGASSWRRRLRVLWVLPLAALLLAIFLAVAPAPPGAAPAAPRPLEASRSG